MSIDAVVDERTLRELYLTGFEIAVRESDPWTVMCAYNRVNGEHCGENHWLMTDLLRDEWGFDGLAMTDWLATFDRAAALRAGLDLEMPGSTATWDRGGGRRPRRRDARHRRSGPRMRARRRPRAPHHSRVARGGARLRCPPRPRAARRGRRDGPPHERRRAAAGRLRPRRRRRRLRGEPPVPGRRKLARHPHAARRLPRRAPRAGGRGARHLRARLRSGHRRDDRRARRRGGARRLRCRRGRPPHRPAEPHGVGGIRSHPPRAPPGPRSPRRGRDGRQPAHRRGAPQRRARGDAVGRQARRDPRGVSGRPGGRLRARRRRPRDRRARRSPRRELPRARFGPSVRRELPRRTHPGRNTGRGCTWDTGSTTPRVSRPSSRSDTGSGTPNSSTLASPSPRSGDGWVVTVTVRNVGARTGSEVVQVYVRDVASAIPRPVKELKGFAKVVLEPGASQKVTIRLDRRAFAFWDVAASDWTVEPGDFEILVGCLVGRHPRLDDHHGSREPRAVGGGLHRRERAVGADLRGKRRRVHRDAGSPHSRGRAASALPPRHHRRRPAGDAPRKGASRSHRPRGAQELRGRR